MKVVLQPTVLQWARNRVGLSEAELAKKLGAKEDKVTEWEQSGEITYKRAEKLAQKTHTPFSLLFLEEPPVETLPVADFRTVGSEESPTPSPDLLDVIYDAMRKQSWYRDFLVEDGAPRLDYVGKATIEDDMNDCARIISQRFGIGTQLRATAKSWSEALDLMFEQCEEHGVLLLRSGTVGDNNHRILNVEEFRGFALTDPYAPTIFINGSDSKAAQMFTLVHELVHLWLGMSGVSNLEATYAPEKRVEQFCNHVAAEILVPLDEMRTKFDQLGELNNPLPALGRHFKVSSLVLLRRLKDINVMDTPTFRKWYDDEVQRFKKQKEKQSSGGNYYATKAVRSGRRLTRALVGSALEGKTSYREALSLLGIKKTATFKELARNLHYNV